MQNPDIGLITVPPQKPRKKTPEAATAPQEPALEVDLDFPSRLSSPAAIKRI